MSLGNSVKIKGIITELPVSVFYLSVILFLLYSRALINQIDWDIYMYISDCDVHVFNVR